MLTPKHTDAGREAHTGTTPPRSREQRPTWYLSRHDVVIRLAGIVHVTPLASSLLSSGLLPFSSLAGNQDALPPTGRSQPPCERCVAVAHSSPFVANLQAAPKKVRPLSRRLDASVRLCACSAFAVWSAPRSTPQSPHRLLLAYIHPNRSERNPQKIKGTIDRNPALRRMRPVGRHTGCLT